MRRGFAIFATLEVGASYWHFLAGLPPFGAGMARAGAPATTAIVASLPREKQGVASAVNDVSRELGGALGIAVLGSVFNSGYRADMSSHTASLAPAVAAKAMSSLAAAQQIGAGLGASGQALIAHAQSAFLNGFGDALTAGAAALILGAVFLLVRAPGRSESRENASQSMPAHAGAQPVDA